MVNTGAYIYKAMLEVKLEEDYVGNTSVGAGSQPALQRRAGLEPAPTGANQTDPRYKVLNEYSSELLRELVIPQMTKSVNSAKRYAALRQVYFSLVLAQWFKRSIQPANPLTRQPANPLSQQIDSGNLTGLTSSAAWDKQAYFAQYRKSFKDGEYRVSETVNSFSGKKIRNYVSGGIKPVVSNFGTVAGSSVIPVLSGNPDFVSFSPQSSSQAASSVALVRNIYAMVDLAKDRTLDSDVRWNKLVELIAGEGKELTIDMLEKIGALKKRADEIKQGDLVIFSLSNKEWGIVESVEGPIDAWVHVKRDASQESWELYPQSRIVLVLVSGEEISPFARIRRNLDTIIERTQEVKGLKGDESPIDTILKRMQEGVGSKDNESPIDTIIKRARQMAGSPIEEQGLGPTTLTFSAVREITDKASAKLAYAKLLDMLARGQFEEAKAFLKGLEQGEGSTLWLLKEQGVKKVIPNKLPLSIPGNAKNGSIFIGRDSKGNYLIEKYDSSKGLNIYGGSLSQEGSGLKINDKKFATFLIMHISASEIASTPRLTKEMQMQVVTALKETQSGGVFSDYLRGVLFPGGVYSRDAELEAAGAIKVEINKLIPGDVVLCNSVGALGEVEKINHVADPRGKYIAVLKNSGVIAGAATFWRLLSPGQVALIKAETETTASSGVEGDEFTPADLKRACEVIISMYIRGEGGELIIHNERKKFIGREISVWYVNGREFDTASLFGPDTIKFRRISTKVRFTVPAGSVKGEEIRKILMAAFNVQDSTASSGVVISDARLATGDMQEVGGIDLRNALQKVYAGPASSSLPIPPLAELEKIDLQKETQELARMIKAGMSPAEERMCKFVCACISKGAQTAASSVLMDLGRAEEDQAVPTSPRIKALLALL